MKWIKTNYDRETTRQLETISPGCWVQWLNYEPLIVDQVFTNQTEAFVLGHFVLEPDRKHLVNIKNVKFLFSPMGGS